MNSYFKVVKNILPPEKLIELMNYIDYMESSNPDVFVVEQDGKRVSIEMGTESARAPEAHWDLSIISEKRALVSELIELVHSEVKKSFNESLPTYVCSLWLAKQYAGGSIPIHDDTNDGLNPHFKYSVVVYLGGPEDLSTLSFPDHNFAYSPESGDLVVFLSKEGGMHEVLDISNTRYSIPIALTTDESMALGWGETK